MAINRRDVKKPVLRKQVVDVDTPDIKGEVVVQALMLHDLLALRRLEDEERQLQETLSRSVVDEDGIPIYTAYEWAIYGAQHPEVVGELYSVTKKLAVGEDTEKKEDAPS